MDVSYRKTATPTNASMSMGPSTATATAIRTPKLKDSCDTCAASKIRCDKRKPLCGRCTKLGYPCFYSPARRTGHARRRSASTDAASVVPVYLPSPSGGGPGGERMDVLARRNSNLNALATPGSDIRSMSTATPQGPTVGGSQDDASASKSQNDASSVQNDASASQSQNDAAASNYSTGTATTGERVCGGTGSAELARQTDCASVAIDMLLQLELAKVKLGLNQRDGQSLGAHATIETATAAFRTLSAVLVCPCSESQDVGLLAAAVCLSMLGVYSAIIGHSTARSPDPPVYPGPMSDSSCLEMSMEDEFLYWDASHDNTNTNGNCANNNSNNNKSISSSSDPLREDVTIVRVLGELTKVARVVLQFTKRYWDGDAEKHSPDFLKALANLLRSQLQSVTAKATV